MFLFLCDGAKLSGLRKWKIGEGCSYEVYIMNTMQCNSERTITHISTGMWFHKLMSAVRQWHDILFVSC